MRITKQNRTKTWEAKKPNGTKYFQQDNTVGSREAGGKHRKETEVSYEEVQQKTREDELNKLRDSQQELQKKVNKNIEQMDHDLKNKMEAFESNNKTFLSALEQKLETKVEAIIESKMLEMTKIVTYTDIYQDRRQYK